MTRFTKVLYALLFLALVLQPHFVQGHFLSVPQAYAQSIAIIILLEIGYLIHFLHQREVKREQQKRLQAENELQFSIEKLNDSYRYIGAVNRRLALLPSLTSDLLLQYRKDNQGRKLIFEELLTTAVITLAHASYGVFRFVRTSDMKTEEEFRYAQEATPFHSWYFDNKKLGEEAQNSNTRIFPFQGFQALRTSDKGASVQCYFLFISNELPPKEQETTLQAIVDQAQIFYKYLYKVEYEEK